jgi:hypothetical protein
LLLDGDPISPAIDLVCATTGLRGPDLDLDNEATKPTPAAVELGGAAMELSAEPRSSMARQWSRTVQP